ncbi:MAG: tetratricopeptide repeat protein [Pseudomonadota bacterium]
MNKRWGIERWSSAACIVGLTWLLGVGHGAAQTRDQVFQALLRDPSNIPLMLQYARLSVEIEDYEAAIGTLERLLDFDPTNQDARWELAQAYFALGQNEVANFHLNLYLERGDLTAGQRAEAQALNTEAQRRSDGGVTTRGRITAGLASRSQEDDIGATLQADVSIDADVNNGALLRWDTDLQLRVVRFPENSTDDIFSFGARTGPVLSLDNIAFGQQLQPYLDYRFVDVDDDEDAGEQFAFGLGYTNAIDARWTIDADAQYGHVFRSGSGFDSTYFSSRIGAQFRATQQTGFRALLQYLDDDEEEGGNDYTRWTGVLGASHDIPRPFLGVGESWSISGFSRVDADNYADGREDDVLGVGVSLMTNLNDTTFVTLGVRQFDRSSSDPAFDEDNTIISLDAGFQF